MKSDKVKVNKSRREVFVGKKRIHLAPKEFDILVALKDSQILMSRGELINRIWGLEAQGDVDARTIDQHISRMRQKLGDAANTIEAVSGFGYRYAR